MTEETEETESAEPETVEEIEEFEETIEEPEEEPEPEPSEPIELAMPVSRRKNSSRRPTQPEMTRKSLKILQPASQS